MKILIALAYEEGDPPSTVRLELADGTVLDLNHEHAQAHLGLEAFDHQLIEKETPK
jgi:hypothetical protein